MFFEQQILWEKSISAFCWIMTCRTLCLYWSTLLCLNRMWRMDSMMFSQGNISFRTADFERIFTNLNKGFEFLGWTRYLDIPTKSPTPKSVIYGKASKNTEELKQKSSTWITHLFWKTKNLNHIEMSIYICLMLHVPHLIRLTSLPIRHIERFNKHN